MSAKHAYSRSHHKYVNIKKHLSLVALVASSYVNVDKFTIYFYSNMLLIKYVENNENFKFDLFRNG